MNLSVILPTFNEVRHGMLERILTNLPQAPWLEVIAVDSGSRDGTLDLLRQHKQIKLLEVGPANRAYRINRGIETATGKVFFIHHPRSLPDPRVFHWLNEHHDRVGWGAMVHKFDHSHPLLKFTSWYSNHVRGRWGGIFYLDHCLYVHRRLWSGDSLPEVDIFEDTLLCRRLRRQVRPRLLDFEATTSAARFRRKGVWKQALLNQAAKMAFLSGVSPRLINEIYEHGLHFNGTLPPSKQKGSK